METLSDRLIGKNFVALEKIDHSIIIRFNDGTSLSIYNRMSAHFIIFDKELPVTSARYQESSYRISFGSASFVEIGLADDDFSGPEAFVYQDTDGALYVES